MEDTTTTKPSFLKKIGKNRWQDLNREEINEYYRDYYQKNKDKYNQHKNPKKCEICDVEVKNMYMHKNTNKHKQIAEIFQRFTT